MQYLGYPTVSRVRFINSVLFQKSNFIRSNMKEKPTGDLTNTGFLLLIIKSLD